MGLPHYIINFDELNDMIGDKININAVGKTDNLENLLNNYFEQLKDLLKQFLNLKFVQKAVGVHSYIPALNFDYEITHTFDRNVILTGITYSQTGWKVIDCWDLYIDDKLLFDSIFTKELGEHKVFNSLYPVKANSKIKIVYHNNSGNSKQVWYDINYYDTSEIIFDEITHKYDWKIVMRWEGGVNTDIDLHLDMDNGESVYFRKKEYIKDENNRVWLDYDFTKHYGENDREEKPEIITILGKPFNTAKVKIRHFSQYSGNQFDKLKDDITIEIFKVYENKEEIIVKEFNINKDVFSENKYDIEVCKIDLKNNEVI